MPRQTRTGTRADVALLGAALVTSLIILLLPGPVRGRLHGALRESVGAPFVALQAWAERGRLAIADRGRLVTQVDSLALAAASSATLRGENERLRALLGLGKRLEWGFVATELLPAPQGGDEHTVTVNAGSESGVRQFSPVVTPQGLVAVVTQVQRSTATAILWTHPDFRASATTADGSAFGIVSSHLGSGADRQLLELRGVPFRATLKPGALVVTSGLGQVFPKGIPIGVVLREVRTIEGWARTYLVRPIVSPGDLGSAMVLLPPRAAAGVEAAWATPAAVEGSQRLIVTAADSVIADSLARIEARLRRLDSLRRAAIFAGDSGIARELDALRSGNDSAGADSLPLDSLARPLPAGARGDSTTRKAATVAVPPARPTTTPMVAAPPARPTAPPTVAVPPARTTATAGATGRDTSAAARARRDSAAARARRDTSPAARARRDSIARARARQQAPAAAARRDSAAARNRARPAVIDSADRPFRLPPLRDR